MLIGRSGGHLCAQARDVVARVSAEFAVDREERSLLDDPAPGRAHVETIPVVLLDGRVHTQLRVGEDRLGDALAGRSL